MATPEHGDRFAARLTAVAALGFLLFAPPLVAIFDRGGQLGGVPIVWVYLLLAWAAVIGLVAAAVRRTD